MQINEKDIPEFIFLSAQKFGETFSESEARETASRLLGFYLILVRPLSRELKARAMPLFNTDTSSHVFHGDVSNLKFL